MFSSSLTPLLSFFVFVGLWLSSLNLMNQVAANQCNFQYPGYVPKPGENTTYYLPIQNGTIPGWEDCPNSTICSEGKEQSPIDLVSEEAILSPDLGPIEFSWRKADNVSLVWTGINQLWSFASSPQDHPSWVVQSVLPPEKFILRQFHLHTPSEHTIDGVHSDVELHFVHQNSARNVTSVIGLMFDVGTNDDWSEFFETIVHNEPSAEDPAGIFFIDSLYPGLALAEINSRSYFHYMGSFTTPTCTEGVFWFVLREVIKIHPDQFSRLEKYQTINNRPVQPLRKRKVVSYVEGPKTFCSRVGEDCQKCKGKCEKTCEKTCQKNDKECQKDCEKQCDKQLCSEVCEQ